MKTKIMVALIIVLFLSGCAHKGRLIIIRHGQSDHNVNHTYNTNPKNKNYTESHLTTVGIEQVHDTVDTLLEKGVSGENIQLMYHSPLPRARETAIILAKRFKFPVQNLIEDMALIEVNAGRREGTSLKNYHHHYWNNEPVKKDGGENDSDVRNRVKPVLIDIISKIKKREVSLEKNIVLVTHGSPSKSLIEWLTGFPVQLETAGKLLVPLDSLEKRMKNYKKARAYAATRSAKYNWENNGQLFSVAQMQKYLKEKG